MICNVVVSGYGNGHYDPDKALVTSVTSTRMSKHLLHKVTYVRKGNRHLHAPRMLVAELCYSMNFD